MSQRIIKNFESHVGQTVDIYPAINNFAMDVIGKATLGVDFELQVSKDERTDSGEGQCIADLAKKLVKTTFGILDTTILHSILPKNRREALVSQTLNDHIEEIIKKKKTSKSEETDEKYVQKDLLDILMHAKNQDEETLSQSELIDQVKTFLLAGSDSSISAISFTLWFIAQNPMVEEKLVEEISAVLGEESESVPTIQSLDKMKYLNNVWKESLRMVPPAHALIRQTTRDTALGGYWIPKDTMVSVSVYALHHSTEFWDRPEIFNPDRWDTDIETHGSFIPFALGTRNCIGQRFAGLEAKAILVMLLKKFTFSIPQDHPKVGRAPTFVAKPFPYIKLIPNLRD